MLRSRALTRHAFRLARPHGSVGRLSSTVAATSHLTSVTENDVAHFAKILPQTSILSTLPPASLPASDLSTYNTDWMGKYHGQSKVVLRPKTVEQVSQILKHCSERGIGVVPQGGNTGLVGGSVPLKDEVVINLGSMSTIRSFDPVSGTFYLGCARELTQTRCVCVGILVADAGCVLETLTEHIGKEDHIMPLDLGAKGRYAAHGKVNDIWKLTHVAI
jgi:hypothetical protein